MAAAAAAASETVFPSSVFNAFVGVSPSAGPDSGAAWSHFRLEAIIVGGGGGGSQCDGVTGLNGGTACKQVESSQRWGRPNANAPLRDYQTDLDHRQRRR